MNISNHYRIENKLGAWIYLDQDEMDQLVALHTFKEAAPETYPSPEKLNTPSQEIQPCKKDWGTCWCHWCYIERRQAVNPRCLGDKPSLRDSYPELFK